MLDIREGNRAMIEGQAADMQDSAIKKASFLRETVTRLHPRNGTSLLLPSPLPVDQGGQR